MNIISLFGSHNASVVVCIDNKIVEVIEVERFINTKNASLSFYIIHERKEEILRHILNYIEKKYFIDKWDLCLHQRAKGLWHLINADNYQETLHHESHAAGSFYQSPFITATIISFDGGGNDGLFNIYSGHRNFGVELIKKVDYDLGVPYSLLGHYMSPIRSEKDILIGNIVYPGKIMGLSAYGNIVDKWKPEIKEYFDSQPRFEDYDSKCRQLFKRIGFNLLSSQKLDSRHSVNLAATTQTVFEELFFEKTNNYISNSKNIVVTGGCSLNILLNTKLKEINPNIYAAPNGSDCGIAAGMILNVIKPDKAVDITFMGSPVLDASMLAEYTELHNAYKIELTQLSKMLLSGKIIGVVMGNCEHGPRALGNRSILCNPMLSEMKQSLNAKVKNREYYRPFAPVCLFEDARDYFEIEGESRHMNFAVNVRDEYKESLSGITHVDGTARLQTLKYNQNPYLYNLLKEFKKLSGFPILLNTSFNIAGKPILNTYRDALWMLENTGLDALFLEGYLFEK